jgi:extracellular factor (EF) 3-hydroxypalmitic acid methyl ester biosynthesis protein
MSSHIVPFQNRKPRLKNYGSLKGETGRRVYFRPERFKGRYLFPDALPTVIIAGHKATLYDLSMNGIAVLVRQPDMLDPGADVDVSLSHLGQELYRDRARVVRHEATAFGTKIAVNLHCTPIHVPSLVDAYAAAALRQQIAALAERQPVLDAVPDDYKQLCADVLFLLREYKMLIENYEHSARQNGTYTSKIEGQIIDSCLESLLPQWKRLWLQANSIVERVMGDKKLLKALKHYTERTLTPEFCQNTGWRWVYDKPLGYPGDHVAMGKFYLNVIEGENAYVKLIDAIGLEIAVFVRSRMAVMQNILAETLTLASQGQEVHVTNIGAGLAFELRALLEQTRFPAHLRCTLVEQEEEAIDKAHRALMLAAGESGNTVTLRCLNASYMDMLRPTQTLETLPPQDIIYSLGIMDYMSDMRAREFITALALRLRDGGRLVIANMHTSPHAPLWPLECIEDWTLVYRTAPEMGSLVTPESGLVAETFVDETGQVVFLIAHKVPIH